MPKNNVHKYVHLTLLYKCPSHLQNSCRTGLPQAPKSVLNIVSFSSKERFQILFRCREIDAGSRVRYSSKLFHIHKIIRQTVMERPSMKCSEN